jgi:hypothetical protein
MKRLPETHWHGVYAITRKSILPPRLTVMKTTSTLIHAPLGSHTMAAVLCLSIGIHLTNNQYDFKLFNFSSCTVQIYIPQVVTCTKDLYV